MRRVPGILAILGLALGTAFPARGGETPRLVSVEGRHVILRMRAEDLAVLDAPKAWVEKLDRAYEAFVELVGRAPFGGKKIVIRSTEGVVGAWAYAGNPITWSREYVAEAFRAVNRGDWSFGILHEMSHDFDLDGRWVWSDELLANFKLDYVLERTKAVVFHEGFVCDYGDPLGLRMADIYRRNELSRRPPGRMLHGGWAKDAYHHKLIELVERIGWAPIRRAFRWLGDLGPRDRSVDPLARRSLFIRAVDDQTEADVAGLFVDWGFSHIDVEGKDPRRAARRLRDKAWNARILARPLDARPGGEVLVRVEVSEEHETRLEKSLETQAPSRIVYDLAGRYERFQSLVGLPRHVAREGGGSVRFVLEADGRRIHRSPVLVGRGACREVEADVRGVRRLALVVEDAGDGDCGDLGAWGDAKLVDGSGRVTFLADLEAITVEHGSTTLPDGTNLSVGPLVLPFRPSTLPLEIVAEVNGRRLALRPSGVPGIHACEIGGLEPGTHLVRLRIRDGRSRITQHELVTVRVSRAARRGM